MSFFQNTALFLRLKILLSILFCELMFFWKIRIFQYFEVLLKSDHLEMKQSQCMA